MVDGDERMLRLRALLASRGPTGASPDDAREAAVSVIVREGTDPELLLIKRAERTGDPWSGHMAFPGGTRSANDIDLVATAYRETREETGIALDHVGLYLGALDPVVPATRRLPLIVIAPFVAAVPAQTPARPDLDEVVDAFWIPLSFLRDERNAHELLIEMGDVSRAFPSVRYGGHPIWGLTHRILVHFLEVARLAGL